MNRTGAVLALIVAALAGVRSAQAADPPIVLVPTLTLGMLDDVVPPIDVTKRTCVWKAKTVLLPTDKIVPPSPGSAGDPTAAGATGGGATFAVYNAAGGTEVFTAPLVSSGWAVAFKTGYRFASPTGPVLKVFVKPDKLWVKAGKLGWGFTLDEPSQGAMAVRLTLGSGVTWCTAVAPNAPASQFDRPGRFFATRAGAPPACPPLP